MEREILFRAKRVDNDEWVYGFYYNETSIESHSSDRKITRHHIYTQDFDKFVNAETLGQYTGLKDKNGTKIFEGDIIQFEDGYTAYIEYKDCAFIFADSPVVPCYLGESAGEDLKVVGNIYDNKELL